MATIIHDHYRHRGKDTREGLEKCWELHIKWELYPNYLKEVGVPLYSHSLNLGIPLFSHSGMPSNKQVTKLATYCYS